MDTERLAKLAKISLTEDEEKQLSVNMEDIIKLMETVCGYESESRDLRDRTIAFDEMRDDAERKEENREGVTFEIPKLM